MLTCVYEVPILELGSLQVFCFQTETEIRAKTACTNIFWRDAASPQGFGPFGTVWEAVEHYKSIIKLTKPSGLLPNGTVVRVDFKTKKKIDEPVQ